MPDAAIDAWLLRHPISVHPVAWSWQHHATSIQQNLGSLQGPLGALAMAHADYAHLMTGIDLDGENTTWKHLLDTRRDIPTDDIPAAEPPPRSAPAPKPHGPQPCFTWLHLSDIHVGHPDAKHRADQDLVLRSLRDDVKQYKNLGLPCIDALFVTGDIAWSGKSEQYAEAKRKLLDIAGLVGVPKERIFIVPGNHDVDRDVDKKDRSVKRLVESLREGTDDLDEALGDDGDRDRLARRQRAYLDFAAELGPRLGNELYGHHAFDTPKDRPRLRVRVVALNSALLARDDEDQGKLRIGKKQLSETLADASEDELVVVLSHHPFTDGWLEPKEQRFADLEARSRAHVHLSGHVHDPSTEDLRTGGGTGIVRIVAGAAHGDAKGPPDHGYGFGAIVPVEHGSGYRVRVYPRRWSDKNRDFRPDMHNLPRDTREPYAEHDVPRLGRKRS